MLTVSTAEVAAESRSVDSARAAAAAGAFAAEPDRVRPAGNPEIGREKFSARLLGPSGQGCGSGVRTPLQWVPGGRIGRELDSSRQAGSGGTM
jgi:hypothetical protein